MKVLDFGLAKAVEGAVALPPSGATITSAAMTMRGMILGTAAYMAPEQAKGKTVDKRAYIWAFGVIRFAEAQGLLATLLQSSLAANPNNADLRALREFRFETTSTRTVGFTEPGSVARVDKVALRHAIQHAYALEELQLLCADVQERCKTLGHDVRLSLDDISGTTKPTKVLNVIEFLDRRRLLDVLVQTVREQRPGSL